MINSFAEPLQRNLKKKAVASFLAITLAVIMEFTISKLGLDRATKSDIVWFIFWPLCLFSLYEASVTLIGWIKTTAPGKIYILLLLVPTIGFFFYFLVQILNLIIANT